MIRGNTSPTSDPGESAVRHVGAFFSPAKATLSSRQLKPFTSTSEQLALLRSRGLAVGDERAALSILHRLGYYRFSGYAHSLKTRSSTTTAGQDDCQETFKDGATFELIAQLADFDKALRMLVLQGLETIEVAARAAVVTRLGKLDVEGHRNPKLFDGRFTSIALNSGQSPYDDWLTRFDNLCARSKEDFVEHHRLHYEGRLPIWAAVEVIEFGMLSRLIAGLQHRDRKALAAQLGVDHPAVLTSWMHAFNVTRNRSAHHARLWNRTNTRAPLLPPLAASGDLAFMHADEHARKRLFGVLCCMRTMLRVIASEHDWHRQLKVLMSSFPRTPTLSIHAAGFPKGWKALPLWRD